MLSREHGGYMRRRDFITALGGAAAAWPLAARAQQPDRPVIGLLAIGTASSWNLAGFRQGLKDAGYSRARTWRSSIALPMMIPPACPNWPRIGAPKGARDRGHRQRTGSPCRGRCDGYD